MNFRFVSVALLLLCSLASVAQASDHAANPQHDDAAGVPHEGDAAGQRRKSALRAALLEQQAQTTVGQKQGQQQTITAEAARPWTAQDRADLRQQIRQQNRSNSRP